MKALFALVVVLCFLVALSGVAAAAWLAYTGHWFFALCAGMFAAFSGARIGNVKIRQTNGAASNEASDGDT